MLKEITMQEAVGLKMVNYSFSECSQQMIILFEGGVFTAIALDDSRDIEDKLFCQGMFSVWGYSDRKLLGLGMITLDDIKQRQAIAELNRLQEAKDREAGQRDLYDKLKLKYGGK